MLQNHKVYVTNWKNARLVLLSEGPFHLDDYINYVQEFVRYVQAEYGNWHVVSVCQPTVPVLAAMSLMSSRGETLPLSMTMMGGPIDARRSPTSVNNLAIKKSFAWFENNVIYRVPQGFAGEGRKVYPGFLQHAGFVAMNPDRHALSHFDYFRDLIKGDGTSAETHRSFYDEYCRLLANPRSIPAAAAEYRARFSDIDAIEHAMRADFNPPIACPHSQRCPAPRCRLRARSCSRCGAPSPTA